MPRDIATVENTTTTTTTIGYGSASPGISPASTNAIELASRAQVLPEPEFLGAQTHPPQVWEQAIPEALQADRDHQRLLRHSTWHDGLPEELQHRWSQAVSLLGVGVTNLDFSGAISLLDFALSATDGVTRPIYYVNAHTLNIASVNPEFRGVLNAAWRVFGDGTGVRWGARAQHARMRANLNGTDLVPRMFYQLADQGYSYYLLGADEQTIARAAEYAQTRFGGWRLAGYHHGYVQGEAAGPMAKEIARCQPDLLLVGMGNPLQENWIHHQRKKLGVKLAMAVGGLFDHWGGNLTRAPRWVRGLGYEWLQILLQQPHKWQRYLVGNPLYLWRIWQNLARDRRQTRQWREQESGVELITI
ncbi:MAG: WecB/TagA/CpsF family glycosyltransferase [Pirellulales bacterium]|nr:WecB/TagA/CpsF family glycosyltransferase [Pirellulales bacterium]